MLSGGGHMRIASIRFAAVAILISGWGFPAKAFDLQRPTAPAVNVQRPSVPMLHDMEAGHGGLASPGNNGSPAIAAPLNNFSSFNNAAPAGGNPSRNTGVGSSASSGSASSGDASYGSKVTGSTGNSGISGGDESGLRRRKLSASGRASKGETSKLGRE
jgi:hypothetical protein